MRRRCSSCFPPGQKNKQALNRNAARNRRAAAAKLLIRHVA
jgi:hypothetical protein